MTDSWCQRWRNGTHSWRHTSEGGFDPSRYDVALVAESQARPFVVQNHYSGSFPAARRCFGLLDRGTLAGVAVLSVPASNKVLTNVFPDQPVETLAELGRFVLLDEVPANAETWMLARVIELAANGDIHGIVAFSDPLPRSTAAGSVVFPGHVGHIYKASSARYLGRSKRRRLSLLPDGRVLSDRAITKVLSQDRGHAYVEDLLVSYGATPKQPDEDSAEWLATACRNIGVRTVAHPGNHRYAFTSHKRRRYMRLGMSIQTPPTPQETQV